MTRKTPFIGFVAVLALVGALVAAPAVGANGDATLSELE